tara:strand:+ start:2174 stop:3202 length:1029 start_codon:yes stop_codon:yes gene_type:complete
MSLLNTTLVVQVNESVNIPSLGVAASATNTLAANNANAKQDGSLGIMVDGAFVTSPAKAGAGSFVKLCTFHAGNKGATVFTSSSEFKIGEITDVTYNETAGSNVDGTDLDFNSFAYYESETENSSTLRKDAILGSGSLKGVREHERLSAISSGAFNQYTYDKVIPLTNADTGQDFCSYTITVRKKNAKNYVSEVIRVYINHTNAFTKIALETVLGLGGLSDTIPPIQSQTTMAFNGQNQPFTVSLEDQINVNIITSEPIGTTYSFTITSNDSPPYVKTYTGTIVDADGDEIHYIVAGTGENQFDYSQTAGGSTLNITGSVTDLSGNTTVVDETSVMQTILEA